MTNCTDGHKWEPRSISYWGCKKCPETLSFDEIAVMLNELQEEMIRKKEGDLMNDQNVPYKPNFVINVVIGRGSILGSLICRLIHKKQLHYYLGPYYVNNHPYYYRHCSICTHSRWLIRDLIKAYLRGDKL